MGQTLDGPERAGFAVGEGMTNRSPLASQSLNLTTEALAGLDHALCVGNIWISDRKMQFKTLDPDLARIDQSFISNWQKRGENGTLLFREHDLALEHTKEMPAIFNKKTADRCGSENP